MQASEEIPHRFNYHPPQTEEVAHKHERVREILKRVAIDLNAIVPPGREASLVSTKLEEAMFWANAGIARTDNYLD